MIQDLGAWAEAEFAALCSRQGVTRNKADQDRMGWDYFLQFPAETIPHLPIDAQPIEREALVQVKSKAKGPPVAKLKLSNALRLAKSPRAAFVILFLATDGTEPVRIFARHLWSEEIGGILERARRAGAPRQVDLHRMTVSLRMTDVDDHTDDLIAWMASEVGGQGDNYANVKGLIVATIGQEGGGIHGTIQVASADLQALVDHQIGLPVPAPIERVTVQQQRFGVNAIIPLIDARPNIADMRVTPKPIRLRLRGAGGPDVWLDAQLFAPAFPNLPKEFFKIRIQGDFLELVTKLDGKGDLTFANHDEDKHSLPRLEALINAMKTASMGSVDVVAVLDGERLFEAEVVLQGDFPARLADLAKLLAALRATAADVAPADLVLSFADLVRAWNDVAVFHNLVCGADLAARFEFDRILPAGVTPSSFIAYDYVDVGDWTFLAVVARPITAYTLGSNTLHFTCGPPQVREAMVRRGLGVASLDELRELFVRTMRLAGPSALAIEQGRYRDFQALPAKETVVRGA